MAVNVDRQRPFPLAPGVVLGIGLGGFVDGIVLHQVLQWHHMLTSAGYPPNSVSNLNLNTLFDGLFHAATWIATAIGLFMLHRAVRRRRAWSGRRLLGGMAIGWGGFNLVEGIIDHHVLHIHHVVERLGVSLWDWLFLGLGGVGLIVLGLLIMNTGRRETNETLAAV